MGGFRLEIFNRITSVRSLWSFVGLILTIFMLSRLENFDLILTNLVLALLFCVSILESIFGKEFPLPDDNGFIDLELFVSNILGQSYNEILPYIKQCKFNKVRIKKGDDDRLKIHHRDTALFLKTLYRDCTDCPDRSIDIKA